ncbi:MAG: zinc ribbon domain-containing protein [Tyzzerella sp.]|nr:zinc ribbon domain-containing protein [Tyzzerella sp.]
MSGIINLIVAIPVLFVMLAIPVSIGVYVYRDAKRREMNAVLWTLVAVFAPSLIGFIIYLLVRGSYSDMQCGSCNASIKEYYVVCPKCGAKLRPSCPNCATPVELDWAVCPKCAQPLPEYQNDIVTPVRPKDKTLWKILLVVIIVPIILIVLMIVSFSVVGSGGSIAHAEVAIEQYLQDVDEPRIKEWLEECDSESDKAYVLEYRTEVEGQKQVRYLIYLPQLADYFNYSATQANGVFGTTLDIDLENVDGVTGKDLNLITYRGDSYADLKLTLDGEKVECEITEVDYSVAPSDYIGE